MIRVVLDTNIIVSALLQPLGPAAQVFALALDGSLQLCVSGKFYAEYEEVISRPRFQRPEDVIAGALQAIRDRSFWCGPRERSGPALTETMTCFSNAQRRGTRTIWSQAI